MLGCIRAYLISVNISGQKVKVKVRLGSLVGWGLAFISSVMYCVALQVDLSHFNWLQLKSSALSANTIQTH